MDHFASYDVGCGESQWVAREVIRVNADGLATDMGNELLPFAPLLTLPQFMLAALLYDIQSAVLCGDAAWLHYRNIDGVAQFALVADWSGEFAEAH